MNSSWQPRAFVQRFFVALLVTAVFTAGGIGMAYWVAADKIDSAKTAKFAPDTLDDVGRGEPANFLIIGSDTRSFIDNATDEEHFGDPSEQTGQRSDTIMIAHIDPDTETGLLVSFPRDLWVDIPGKGPGEAQLGVQRRSAAGRRHDQAELRHPDQPLPRDRLRRLPQHRRRDRDGADLLPDTGARHPDRARHPGGGMPAPRRRDGAQLRAVAVLRVLREREVARRRLVRPRPHLAAAVLHPLARQRGGEVGIPQLHEDQRHHQQDRRQHHPRPRLSDSPTSSRSRRPSGRSIPESSRW